MIFNKLARSNRKEDVPPFLTRTFLVFIVGILMRHKQIRLHYFSRQVFLRSRCKIGHKTNAIYNAQKMSSISFLKVENGGDSDGYH